MEIKYLQKGLLLQCKGYELPFRVIDVHNDTRICDILNPSDNSTLHISFDIIEKEFDYIYSPVGNEL